MENNQEATPKFDYTTLSLAKQYIWKFCKQILRDLKNGECNEEDVSDLIASVEPQKHGFFREEDFLNSDQAMKILQLGQNRNLFFDLLKTYKVEAQTFKGVKIGYKRADIYALNERLKELNRRKRNKRLTHK